MLRTFAMIKSCEPRFFETIVRGGRGGVVWMVMMAAMMSGRAAGQQAAASCSGRVVIQGVVLGVDRKPVEAAVVRLAMKPSANVVEKKTDAAGGFTFSALGVGHYGLSAERSGARSAEVEVSTTAGDCRERAELVLEAPGLHGAAWSGSAAQAQAMEFADQPNFTIAGVTDWTAVGGHGSDSTLRTSESLASETSHLKAAGVGGGEAGTAGDVGVDVASESKLRAGLAATPNGFEANHRLGAYYLRARRYPEALPLLERAYALDPANDENTYDLALTYAEGPKLAEADRHIQQLLADHPSANLYRLAGKTDERSGDPLRAVHAYERAAKLDPSEQNYFEWGSELLLHRAVWQAQEVFRKGAEAYPASVRMQTAMGAALFAGARYEEAAVRLCKASELNPADANPYIFMGKIQMAAPNALACVEPALARFVQTQPENSEANYLYAMSILKRHEQIPDQEATQRAEALLTKAVSIDGRCSEGYLELGVLAASRHSFDKAIGFYARAIEADPKLADAYYRLGVAYDRTGQPEKAKREFQLHDQIKQQQADETERQRREVKQFLIVLSGASTVQ